jgi:hypothetical protein
MVHLAIASERRSVGNFVMLRAIASVEIALDRIWVAAAARVKSTRTVAIVTANVTMTNLIISTLDYS